MNINSVEQSLVKYHLLHFVIGLAFAAILLAVPKIIGVLLCVFLLALVLPSAILPEFANKWFSRAAVVAGAVVVFLLFHFLGKI